MIAVFGAFLFTFLTFIAGHGVSALEIVNRTEWSALPPKSIEHINKSVPFAVIHHTYIPPACFTQDDCSDAMRSMQLFHQNDRGWTDIGYNFCVGGDGKVYEGRGFDVVGTHAPKYNEKSIGICLIGDWQEVVPPQNMLNATHELIAYAVELGYLTTDYKLIGHKQVRATICPGPALFGEIQKWPHFDGDIHFNIAATSEAPSHVKPLN